MDVLQVKVARARRHVLEPLPDHCFCMCIVAPPRSGKSNLIANVLKNKHWGYDKVFDRVLFISPTVQHDKTIQACLSPADEHITLESNIDAMPALLKAALAQQEEDLKQRLLIIFDDCVGFLGREVEALVSKYRHYNASVIISSQQFRKIPPTARTCANYWVLFRTHNKKEIEKMNEEFSGQYRDFLKFYNEATAERYSFLFMDIDDSSLYENFTKKLT